MTMKKQKSEPRKIDCWSPDDLTFLDNRTKEFSFSSPYDLERDLERRAESLKCSQTEPGLTLLESILREFEDEAKKKLEENGLDSEWLTEVWRTFFDPKDFSRLRLHLEYDFPSLLEPLETSMQLQMAAHVAFAADRVRNDISNGNAEQTAIDMLKLCFSIVGANLHEIIVRGIRAKGAPFKVRGTKKRPEGLLSAFKYALKNSPKKDGPSLWKFLKEYCRGDDKIFNGFDIIFEEKENKIYQYSREGKFRRIGFRGFQRRLSEIKKSQ